MTVDNSSTGTYTILTTEGSQSMGQLMPQVKAILSQPRPSVGYNPPLDVHLPEVQGRGGNYSTDALGTPMSLLASVNQFEQQLLEKIERSQAA